eukprot:m.27649 g.27649  ORF g.27649 m.27649 type:complete len:311 (+) comp4798_c0_seq1:400-1332(+)
MHRPAIATCGALLCAAAASAASTVAATSAPPTTTLAPLEPISDGGSLALLVAAIPGLFLAFFGRRYGGIARFASAFLLGSLFFYIMSPAIFPFDKFCCGNDTPNTNRVLISLAIGLVAAGIAKCIVKLGFIAIGACLGLLTAIVLLLTPIKHWSFLSTRIHFILYYTVMMLAGIMIVSCASKQVCMLTTAFGGSFLTMLGIDYVVESRLAALVLYFLRQLGKAIGSDIEKNSVSAPQFDRDLTDAQIGMITGWLFLGLLAFAFQIHDNKENSVEVMTAHTLPIHVDDIDLGGSHASTSSNNQALQAETSA